MKDYKLKQRNLRASHTLGWSYTYLVRNLVSEDQDWLQEGVLRKRGLCDVEKIQGYDDRGGTHVVIDRTVHSYTEQIMHILISWRSFQEVKLSEDHQCQWKRQTLEEVVDSEWLDTQLQLDREEGVPGEEHERKWQKLRQDHWETVPVRERGYGTSHGHLTTGRDKVTTW